MARSFAKAAGRMLTVGTIAAALGLALAAGPAAADNWRDRDWRHGRHWDRHHHHHHHWHRPPPPRYYYAPPPRVYYAPPPVYYAPPPPVYYGPPTLGFNFVVPLR